MSKAATKTDNSNFYLKTKLRYESINHSRDLKILDAFHGSGKIWNSIQQKHPEQKFIVLGIDTKKDSTGLIGRNQKFLPNLRLNEFDVIDLDAYGFPVEQLELIKNKLNERQIIFATFCCAAEGGIPSTLLKRLGYTGSMIEKCPTLFYRHPLQKIFSYLWLYGVRKMSYYYDIRGANKHFYLAFRQEKSPKF